MGRFLTSDGFIAQFGEAEAQLIAGTGAFNSLEGSQIDVAQIDKEIAFVDELIAGFVIVRHDWLRTVDVQDMPNLLQGFGYDIVRYRLRDKKGSQGQITDTVEERYKAAMKGLQAISEGKLDLPRDRLDGADLDSIETPDPNRVSERSAAAAKRATDLYTRSVGRLGRAQDALRARMRRTNQVIATQRARLRSSAAMMRDGAIGVGRAALVAGGLWTAYSGTVSAAGAAMLSPTRQFERFQTVLTTTEGSALAAQEAMKWVEDFAVKTPYELDQVMASFVQLRAYGLDPTNGMLKTLGDASAAMNKPLMQSVEAMADAVTGENAIWPNASVPSSMQIHI